MTFLSDPSNDTAVNWEEICFEDAEQEDREVIQINEIADAPAKLDDVRQVDQTNVIEVNLGLGSDYKPTYVNAALEAVEFQSIITL